MNNLNDEVYILVEFNPIACCLYKYKVFYDIPNEDEIFRFNEMVYAGNLYNQRITMVIKCKNKENFTTKRIEDECIKAFLNIFEIRGEE